MLNALWNPIVAGKIALPHRLAMAPLTRSRATPDGVPTELNAEYYAQRASHALIITEGTQPSADGQGYPVTPDIYTVEHIAGWRKVTDAVHNAGGRIGIQLMHAGRIAHPDNDLLESDPHELYPHLLRALAPLDLAYLHIGHGGDEELLHTLRKLWPNTLLLNRAGTDIPTRVKDIENGLADVVTVGSMALANPDLVERVRTDSPLNTPDPATFYGGGAAGYTDYPTLTA